MMLYEEDWAAVILRSRWPYKDTMRSWAETLRCWRTARQAPRTPRGRRRRKTSAPWPGPMPRAWRAPPWPRSCSASPSWCRWPWAASPSCPRPPRSAWCGPWSSWPEMLTLCYPTTLLHSISTGHMVTLTVFVNQLSWADRTQGLGHDHPVIVVSTLMTGVVSRSNNATCAPGLWRQIFLDKCSNASLCSCACVGASSGPVLVSPVPGAPVWPGQEVSSLAQRAESSKCGPRHRTLIVSSHSKEMAARRLWNGNGTLSHTTFYTYIYFNPHKDQQDLNSCLKSE